MYIATAMHREAEGREGEILPQSDQASMAASNYTAEVDKPKIFYGFTQ